MIGIIYLLVMIFMTYCYWKVYEKCGEPGWACLIPFYNIIVLLRIVKWEPVKFWFFFIPIYNIYLSFMLMKDLAAKFGKDSNFAIGLFLLPFIFIPILALKGNLEGAPVAE